jgi:hypothetical protein
MGDESNREPTYCSPLRTARVGELYRVVNGELRLIEGVRVEPGGYWRGETFIVTEVSLCPWVNQGDRSIKSYPAADGAVACHPPLVMDEVQWMEGPPLRDEE